MFLTDTKYTHLLFIFLNIMFDQSTDQKLQTFCTFQKPVHIIKYICNKSASSMLLNYIAVLKPICRDRHHNADFKCNADGYLQVAYLSRVTNV
jgi:hypothetical protein